MTKVEYLAQLRMSLSDYPEDFQNEILSDFEDHFMDGMEQGKSEQEIMDELGTVEDVLENIRMMHDLPGKDPLRQNLEELSGTLFDALQSVSSVVIDGLNSAVTNISENKEDRLSSNSGTLSNPAKIAIYAGTSNCDILMRYGTQLSYQFQPVFSLFSSKQAELEIQEDNTTEFLVHNGSAKLLLTIPDTVQSIQIQSSSGDCTFRDIACAELDIRTFSGDISAEEIQCDTMTLKASSGDIKIKRVNASNIALSAKSGDIEAERCHGDIQADSLSGDIDIKSHEGNHVTAKITSGDLDIDTTATEVIAKSISGDIDIRCSSPLMYLKAETKSGDIDIKSKNKDYTATLSTVSGSLANKAHLPADKLNKRNITVGDGIGEITLLSVSGDITIR
ncbi:MAG: DUF4097 family beta strand repeat protein [Solobacterium sp.]|nr:DUF4097 family beta strand repeat protein [Solobacterium sp.]